MANFEVKSRKTIIDEKTGKEKSINEIFLVENVESFGEAEKKVLEYYDCANDILGVSLSKVMEVINYPTSEEKEQLKMFRSVLVSTFIDDEGNEKQTKYPVLVWAKDVHDAMTITTNYIKQGYDDMTLVGIQKTKIVEVI